MQFDNSYARLPDRMFARVAPTPVAEPGLIAVNAPLARELGLDPEWLQSPEGLAVLAGNALPEGADPLTQAYAGQQFGNWVPQLGDGRAVLLGELIARDGSHQDWQLKGAGRTPFSRGGDGRAWMGPVIREYLISEAMHALGVPTTRALAAVTTGEPVWREGALPGAILSRIAPSHIRVGTFQYFSAREDLEALRLLTDLACARHYPGVSGAEGLLEAATRAQAELIAQWMGLGFIHGVMNTDNAHVGGITIDYGPCAYMDGYHPDKVFSSIDRNGRYAYSNQPQIAVWNIAQLASALLPLIDPDEAKAVERATAIVHRYADLYQAAWGRRFRAKLGLLTEEEGDIALIHRLLDRMAKLNADFTRTFRGLAEGTARDEFIEREAFDTWEAEWLARLAREGSTVEEARARIATVSPAIIPRNHRIEGAIASAVAGDMAPFHRLETALKTPFAAAPDDPLRHAPVQNEIVRQTFCGT
ncbi:YdiU family protein [Falsigemmobacter intermedius]|uniref:Protein nucleotidyltransferase YdiU n=1 Tax=Falsigemmobacter intermedius TaxID=1553448 RepID=A0A444MEY5_9RHOB|nr:YdiU family protein [Falsigemmobacter intermedius]RWY43558.1 YdiU family protein [Falsigemmobacter intermedius]